MPSGRLLAAPVRHGGAAWALAAFGDGGRVASGAIDGTLRVWDTSAREGGLVPVAVAGDTGSGAAVRAAALTPARRPGGGG